MKDTKKTEKPEKDIKTYYCPDCGVQDGEKHKPDCKILACWTAAEEYRKRRMSKI